MILEDSITNEVPTVKNREELIEKESLAKGHSEDHSLTSGSSSPSEVFREPSTAINNESIQLDEKSQSDKDNKPTLVEVPFTDEEEETRLAAVEEHALNDDDDKSHASASTVLSDLSSLEETPELDRLEDDFELRDRLIKKVVSEKGPEYLCIVNDYEQSMRKALREHYEQQAVQDHKRCLKNRKSKRLTHSYLKRISGALLLNETARGCASLLLYCVAHLSCWEMATALLYEATQNYENQTLVHYIYLFISLAMLRVSGGIFGWLDSKTYRQAQAALKGRQSTLDGRIIRWFRRRPNLKAVVNMLAFYICWAAVAFFQARGLRVFDKRDAVIASLPSFHRDDVITSVKDKLIYGLSYGEEALDFEARDYEHLLREVSTSSCWQLLGDETAALVSTTATFLFFGTAAAVSIALLRFKLGHTFET